MHLSFTCINCVVQASASNPQYIHLSVSTPLISTEVLHPHALPDTTLKAVQEVHSGIIEVVEPTKDGFQLTLRIDLAKFPKRKGLDILIFHINVGLFSLFIYLFKERTVQISQK